LSQSAGTLIIDQPEDDLDNRVIMQIVSLIRKSKDRRQLLFTTHNPNIVVNGDADKVIALKSGDTAQPDEGRIQIDVDGAIETPEIRKVITHIMEGGKAAFDLRNRKYNFETIAD
jgi:ABC-type cobalamin/Fe3+-siderophores transport system ATPase subunit